MSQLDVSVIIPVYNESGRIRNTIRAVLGYFSQLGVSFEIIIVDDGSSDNSLQVIREECEADKEKVFFLKNRNNIGKGYSVKRGMMFARGEIALFTDADLSTPISEYEKLEHALLAEGYDIAIGSRSIPGSNVVVPQNFIRNRMGKLFGRLVNSLVLPDIVDSQCGFKAFKREAAHLVFHWQTIFGFGFDPEVLFIAKKHGYKIKEVPITWVNHFDSKLNPIKDSFFIGFELFKIRLKIMLGHYDL